jgi:hypothetical protein
MDGLSALYATETTAEPPEKFSQEQHLFFH